MSTETFTQVEGRDVIASDTAESIGSVKGFVLDRRGRRIEAIHIAGRGKKATIVDWSAIAAFGADAVMVPTESDTSAIGDEHEKEAVKGAIAMIGTRVLTTEGVEFGKVDDVEFDTGSGDVIRVMTARGAISANQLRSLGSYALVVDGDPSDQPKVPA